MCNGGNTDVVLPIPIRYSQNSGEDYFVSKACMGFLLSKASHFKEPSTIRLQLSSDGAAVLTNPISVVHGCKSWETPLALGNVHLAALECCGIGYARGQ